MGRLHHQGFALYTGGQKRAEQDLRLEAHFGSNGKMVGMGNSVLLSGLCNPAQPAYPGNISALGASYLCSVSVN